MARRNLKKRQMRDDGAKPCTGLMATLPVFLLSAVSYSILRYFVQPLFRSDEYYIDEEFHVPQARRYCQAAFHQVGVLFYSFSINSINSFFCIDTQCAV
jgi:hypothetical protein